MVIGKQSEQGWTQSDIEIERAHNENTDKEKSQASHAPSSVNCAIGGRESKCYAKPAKKNQTLYCVLSTEILACAKIEFLILIFTLNPTISFPLHQVIQRGSKVR